MKYETITVNGYWNAIPEFGLPDIEPFENMTVALGSWDGEEDADDERIFFYLDGKTPIGDHGEFTITKIIDEMNAKEVLARLDIVATALYNMEGDAYQQAYEKLEEVIDQLKGESK